MKESFVILLASAPLTLGLICLIISLIPVCKIKNSNVFLNYYSIYIILELFFVIVARLYINSRSVSFSDFMFLALPSTVIVLWALKKKMFIWLFVAYSIGMMLFYSINAFEPRMSITTNFQVVIFHALVMSSYLLFLNVKYRHEFVRSLKEFRFWLNDYDKKIARDALFPYVAMGVVYIIIILIVVIKFHRVFQANLNW